MLAPGLVQSSRSALKRRSRNAFLRCFSSSALCRSQSLRSTLSSIWAPTGLINKTADECESEIPFH
jgi:hypothetical protein